MPSRHKSREQALQVLFLADIRQQPAEDAIRAYFESLTGEEDAPVPGPDPFMEQLVRGTIGACQAIDERISAHAENWRLARMPLVDRNIMRMAIYEMTAIGTPAPVVIDEALQLARRYSTEEAVAFINGVLDAVRKEISASVP